LLYAFKTIRPGEANGYFGFPPGVPLLGAALERATGNPRAVHWLTPLTAAGLVIAISALGRWLIGGWAGWWAAVGLLGSITFWQFSTALFSEVPGAAFIYTGLTLLVFALRRQRDDAWALGLALVGTSLVSASLFMRFSNLSIWPAVLALPLLLAGRRAFRQRRTWVSLGVMLLATGGLFIFNTVYYGGPFVTGYSPQHGWYAQPAFSLSYAFGKSFMDGYSVPVMAKTLWTDMGGFVLLALIGLTAARAPAARAGIDRAGPAGAYAVYAFAPQGVNARFIFRPCPRCFCWPAKG